MGECDFRGDFLILVYGIGWFSLWIFFLIDIVDKFVVCEIERIGIFVKED